MKTWSIAGVTRLGLLAGMALVGSSGCGGDVAPDHDDPIGEYSQEATLSSCSESVILAAAPSERRAILDRGFTWVNQGILYSQTPQRAQNGYRTDCSGFISMCWGFGAPGNTTYSFAGGPWDDGRTHRIAWGDLEPGDALNNPQHHVMLFGGWLDEAHTRFCSLEEYNWGHPASIIHHSVYETFNGVPFRNAFIPMRFNHDPPGSSGATTTTGDRGGTTGGTTGGTSGGTTGGTPGGGSTSEPTCYSHTLERAMPSMSCVESRFDHSWYQCVRGAWEPGNGAYGHCASSNPLVAPTSNATCYSSTLGRNVTERTCLQSRLDSAWYQCTDSGWVYGPSIASGHTGTLGACGDWIPLH